MKKLISILTAAALLICSATCGAAGEQNMSAAEKESFISENLDARHRHLSTLVTLSANMVYDKIAGEVEAALNDGLTPVEIKEAIYHSAAYCGYTRAAGALDAADAALETLGADTAYRTRITSNEENRYNDGLTVQRFLFGPQIGTITEGMAPAMKLQTLYLSGICFGDFYNRTGLSLYDREFLTFCTIVADGNCQGQLMGHANGNYGVGHSPDMLRAAILANEDVNGPEKTAQALSVIDTVPGAAAENVKPEPEEKTPVTLDYESDSAELLATMEHYRTDDADGFIAANLDGQAQSLVTEATIAAINGTAAPTSDNKALQNLIDLAVIAAEGGREAEVPAKVAEGISAGNSGDRMLAAALLATPYNGFPRTLNIMSAINSALADLPEPEKTVVTMTIGSPTMTVNGAEAPIDAEGTVPMVTNGRTLLPVRAFVEAIGGSVSWDDASRTATLTYNGTEIKLTVDSAAALLNGEERTLDVAPVVVNGRTMLPIRFIAESFGFTVLWNGETQTVTVIDADTIDYVFPRGMVNPVPNFTGVSYLNFMTGYDETMKIPSFGLVTFEPCTRTDWHSHDGGQILLVTEGRGIFKAEGEPARYMLPGDVIMIAPGQKHIHAAADDSWFAHIALSTNPGAGTTNWYEKVGDEEYQTYVAEAEASGRTAEVRNTVFPRGEAYTSQGLNGAAYKNTLVEYENIWNCPEVDNYTLEAGASVSPHSHQGGQIIAVTNGGGSYTENGETKELKPGDILTVQPGAIHSITAGGSGIAFIAVNGNPGSDAVTWESGPVAPTEQSAVAKTEAGLVQGEIRNGIYTYLGVPYAEAKERFVPAEKVTPWEGVRPALEYGPMSPQGMVQGGTDNNCQNLNIWTPALADGGKRPVMVWLHGGGFSSGTANETTTDGENLSRKGDVVVVSVNHRLNLMGHLDLSAYGDKYKYSANVGIADIVDALKWIRDNIEQFGGDPDNVTVFGESGGGAKVLALMTAPEAKGLFDKGIVESGATETVGPVFTSLEASRRVTELMLGELGITPDRIEELQTVDYDRLNEAGNAALAQTAQEFKIPAALGAGYSMEWEPVLDGDYMPTDPVTADSFAEAGRDVPLLIGTNLNEWTVMGSMFGGGQQDNAGLDERMRQTYGDDAQRVMEEFAKAYPNEEPENALYIDTLIRMPILKIMSHKADQNGAPVYSYIFSWGTSYHTAEIPFVFNNVDKTQVSGDPEEARKLSEVMSQAWINFARTGNPGGNGVPSWEPYTRSGGAVMIFDNETYLTHNHDKELLEILAPDYEY